MAKYPPPLPSMLRDKKNHNQPTWHTDFSRVQVSRLTGPHAPLYGMGYRPEQKGIGGRNKKKHTFRAINFFSGKNQKDVHSDHIH